jgi:hypothetical protein
MLVSKMAINLGYLSQILALCLLRQRLLYLFMLRSKQNSTSYNSDLSLNLKPRSSESSQH